MTTQLDLFGSFSEKYNEILTAKTYGEFRELLVRSGCNKCDLSKSRTNIVPDRGNPEARIVAIGEGPGENEDIQGAAFVGRAGQLLDKIMASIRLDANRDMLIANIVKCRPPENRAPTREEAQTCLPYLWKQIELVKPKVILLLGATALKHLIPSKRSFSMAEEAGKLFPLPKDPEIQCMVLYHPAYLLRDPRKKAPMWEHVKNLRRYLKEEGIAFEG